MSALLVAIGGASSLGLDAATLQAESAAGTLRFTQTEAKDLRGEPVRAARLGTIPEGASRLERMVALAELAAAAPIARAVELEVGLLPVFLALPAAPAAGPTGAEAPPGQAQGQAQAQEEDAAQILAALRRLAGVELALREDLPQRVRAGRAGFAEALDRALRYLTRNPTTRAALVGGVDSLVDPASLARLVAEDRTLGEGVDGTIPGEGAGFALLLRADGPVAAALAQEERAGAPRLVGTAFAREPAPLAARRRGEVSVAAGLGQVFRSLSASPTAGQRRVGLVLAGHSGERSFHRELSYAAMRAAELMPDPFAFGIPAAHFGDLGAATGALGLVLAERALVELGRVELGRAGARVLLYGSADAGEIGAFVVEAGPAPRSAMRAAIAARADEEEASTEEQTREGEGASPDPAAFRASFHEEHLEEAGYLAEDLARDLRAALIPWSALGDAEARLGGHLSALLADSSFPALTCAEHLHDRDLDVALGAALLLCDPRAPLACLHALLAALPELPEARLPFVERVLRRAEHPSLDLLLLGHARAEPPAVGAMAVRLVGHHRGPHAFALIRLVADAGLAFEVREAAARALGRIRAEEGASAIAALLAERPGSAEATAALLALGHRAGGAELRAALAGRIPGQPTPSPAMLRLAGASLDRSEAELLRSALHFLGQRPERAELLPPALAALATLGLPEDVPLLLRHLEDEAPAVVRAAAEGLERITGAGFTELVWVADEEEGEAQAYQERRTSTDPARWGTFWREAEGRLRRGLRHRRGAPFRLLSCVEELEGPHGYELRSAIAEELRLRAGCAIDFEPDWSIGRQRSALAALRQTLLEIEEKGRRR